MIFYKKIHNRRSIRLKGYDYAQEGLYFITTCVQDNECLFGKIENGIMHLNAEGKMVDEAWLKILDRFPNTKLHEYTIMPNHFHAILEITVRATLVVAPKGRAAFSVEGRAITRVAPTRERVTRRATTRVAPTAPTAPARLGDIVGAFKSITTLHYIRGVKRKNWKPFNKRLWQRNYYEHIIRNEEAYLNISNYIINNPKKWNADKFYS